MKKILLILVIVILSSNIVFANNKIDPHRNQLEQYMNSEYDFLGMRGEDLYFNLREEYSNNNIFKKIAFDVKTTDLQLKTSAKCFKDNKEIYLVLLLPGFKKFAFTPLKPIF